MKIKPEHIAHMKAELDQFDVPAIATAYDLGRFPRSDQVNDLQTRFVFDMFYAAGLATWKCNTLTYGVNDSHIKTALNSILPAVTRKY